MGLHIIVAYDGPRANDNPQVIYCGGSADDAIAAMDSNTTAFRFERLQNPLGIRKHNRNRVPVLPDGMLPPITQTAPADAPASLAEFGQSRKRR